MWILKQFTHSEYNTQEIGDTEWGTVVCVCVFVCVLKIRRFLWVLKFYNKR